MLHKEEYFAWLPVQAATPTGARWAWFELVTRECWTTAKGRGPWRYYTAN
jgi:hypothetical protein